MKTIKKKGLMAMPIVVVATIGITIVAIALSLITAERVLFTKEYVLNETRADLTLYNFLVDNTCSKTKITNAELLSIGIMQKKEAHEEIELHYGGIKDKIIFKTCITNFFKNIKYEKKYYFSATDKITTIIVGETVKDGTKTITYIPKLNDDQIKITLVREYE